MDINLTFLTFVTLVYVTDTWLNLTFSTEISQWLQLCLCFMSQIRGQFCQLRVYTVLVGLMMYLSHPDNTQRSPVFLCWCKVDCLSFACLPGTSKLFPEFEPLDSSLIFISLYGCNVWRALCRMILSLRIENIHKIWAMVMTQFVRIYLSCAFLLFEERRNLWIRSCNA